MKKVFLFHSFSPCLAPLPNFIQIGQRTRKLEIFTFGRFWLVGLVGRKMVVGILNSFYSGASLQGISWGQANFSHELKFSYSQYRNKQENN